MLNYILQIMLFQFLFILIYEVFLKKETFFNWNRFYLIFTSILSYVIPFVKIKYLEKYTINTVGIPILNNVEYIKLHSQKASIQNLSKGNFFTFENLYFTGLIIMLLLFIFKLSQLIYKIKTQKIIRKSNFKLVILSAEQECAFSFFDYIFIGKRILQNDYQHILQHELIHVQEKHSLDLLFFEIQKILFWFNPFSYIYAYKISVLHEYIADAKTIKETNKKSFFENLILQTFQIEKIPFVSNYHKKSLLKHRIMMATKNKSKKILKMKYLFVFPIIAIMLFIASCNTQESELNKEEKIANFSTIKKSPIFPGCEDEMDNSAVKQCFKTKMQKFVFNNFNASLASKLNLKPGRKKIAVQFLINKKGEITDVKARAPHPKLKEEIIRVIKKLPNMLPAEDVNGNKTTVRYNLPVIFMVEEDKDQPKKISDANLKAVPAPPSPPAPLSPTTPINPLKTNK